jgi:hypothetical protein
VAVSLPLAIATQAEFIVNARTSQLIAAEVEHHEAPVLTERTKESSVLVITSVLRCIFIPRTPSRCRQQYCDYNALVPTEVKLLASWFNKHFLAITTGH